MGKQNNTVKFSVPGFFGCSGVFRSVSVFQYYSVPGFSTCRSRAQQRAKYGQILQLTANCIAAIMVSPV